MATIRVGIVALLGVVALALGAPAAWGASPASYAWGANTVGELGDGTTTNSAVPVLVGRLGEVDALAMGDAHSLALLADGEVMEWGETVDTQIGHGDNEHTDLPEPVPGLSGVTAIAAGEKHSLALLSDGTVVAWGANNDGQLGDGNTHDSETPEPVSGLSGVVAIAAGGNDSLALLGDGTVMAWGAGESGQLGDGLSENSDVPVAVSALHEVTQVSAGFNFGLALLNDGEARSWGANGDGQLGVGKACGCSKSLVPVAVKGLSEAVSVSAGDVHALALLRSGDVVAWGANNFGQLGDGGFEDAFEPVAVRELSGVAEVSAGGRHSVALLGDGTVKSWGGDEDGEVGNGESGTRLNVPLPVSIACGLEGIRGISAGLSGALAWGAQNEGCPTVTAVSPDEGPPAGETSVTISGTGFSGATAVKFGSTEATTFTVKSPTTISAVSPAGAETVDVTVTTANGTSVTNAGDRFTYSAKPTVTTVHPDTGSAGGGRTVTVTGTNLANVTAVTFGETAATRFTLGSAHELTAVAPAGSGTVNVTVTNPSGTSATSPADLFTYTQPPEFGRCFGVGQGHGQYSTATCQFLGEAKTAFEWFPGFGGSRPLGKRSFTISATTLKLETTGKALITCTGASAAGEYTGAQTVTIGVLTLTGCHEGAKGSCQSTLSEGEVQTSALAGQLGYSKQKPPPKAGIELAPASGETVAEFTCAGAPVSLHGSVILEVKANRMLTTGTWKGVQAKGKQKPTSFEGGPEAVLRVKIGSAAGYEQAGLSGTISESNAEAVEINSEV
jgi:alpha-tubulin suppressor-like RCC1 family protein